MLSGFLHSTKFANNSRTMLSGGPRLIPDNNTKYFGLILPDSECLNAIIILADVILIESTSLTDGLTLPLPLLELIF